MSFSTTELFWQAVILGVATYGWLLYLTWEASYYKNRRKRELWFERPLPPWFSMAVILVADIGVLGSFTYSVIKAASAPRISLQHEIQVDDWRPEIPECDDSVELWDCIRHEGDDDE